MNRPEPPEVKTARFSLQGTIAAYRRGQVPYSAVQAAEVELSRVRAEVAKAEADRLQAIHDQMASAFSRGLGARDPQDRERVRRYEQRGGPLQGYRGVTAHLDP